MKLKKHLIDFNNLIEFSDQIQSGVKEKIIRYINENDEIYLITDNNLYLGFIHLEIFNKKISIKLYLSSNWKGDFNEQLFDNISELIKNSNQNYLTFLHCFDSKNILNRLKGIDFMHQYECNKNFHKPNPKLNSNFTISKNISDYKELIDFHYLCYSDDKDYMNSNWENILQSFHKAPIPKIIYICHNKDNIIGSCIGYLIPKKNKKYLYSICVHPDYRRKSIGEYLLQLFLSTEPLISCYLTVYESAKPAVKLYEKFGFIRVQTVEAIISNDVKISIE